MGRLKLFLPLLLFIPLGLLLMKGLQLDPQALPSALLDKPLPAFSLPALGDPGQVLTRDDIVGTKSLINVWATWCPTCRAEHPALVALARERGVRIIGLNYKDERAAALGWLARLGDPYALNIFDAEGRLGLDLGVYGAPETFVVDSAGVIRYKHVGVIDEKVWQENLLPVFEEIQ